VHIQVVNQDTRMEHHRANILLKAHHHLANLANHTAHHLPVKELRPLDKGRMGSRPLDKRLLDKHPMDRLHQARHHHLAARMALLKELHLAKPHLAKPHPVAILAKARILSSLIRHKALINRNIHLVHLGTLDTHQPVQVTERQCLAMVATPEVCILLIQLLVEACTHLLPAG
jgi:hypothetical protein